MMITQLTPFRIVPALIRRTWLQITLLICVLAVRIGAEMLDERKRGYGLGIKVLHVLFILIVAWAVNRVLTLVHEREMQTPRINPGMRAIFFLLARIAVASMAVLVALDTIGISVTPLIASLGVGSLAVALALQDTLGNLFSGFYLNLDRPVSPGDWIQVENGARGQVENIGWRTTRVRLGDNNLLIIPNSKLASSIITNFTLGRNEMAASLMLRVTATANLDEVERLGVLTATEVLSRIEGGVVDPAPTMRFQGFGEAGIDVTLGFRVKQYGDQYLATHELVKAMQKAFQGAGIDIPFPKQPPTVTVVQPKSAGSSLLPDHSGRT